jgi:hypothetical protein
VATYQISTRVGPSSQFPDYVRRVNDPIGGFSGINDDGRLKPGARAEIEREGDQQFDFTRNNGK